MKKTLVYVDAENISPCEADYWLRYIREDANPDEIVIGKFYGNGRLIAAVMQICYDNGFDYVETSSMLSGQKKNITDMKITVDCLFDALVSYRGEVSKVIVLSKDCDFTPLIYKLRGSSVNVEVPLYDAEDRVFTVGDLNAKLHEMGFNPIYKGSEALSCPYPMVREVAPEGFSDEVVLSCVDKRRKRLLKELALLIDDDKLTKLYNVPVQEFDFAVLARCVNMPSGQLANLYVSKFWGYKYKNDESEYFANEYLAKYSERTAV